MLLSQTARILTHKPFQRGLSPTSSSMVPCRNFWGWINMMFNRVDHARLKVVGPDRLCAEWLLRNGARAKFVGVAREQVNYNLLPDEKTPVQIEELDGTDSGIMYIGFDHLKGLKRLRKVKLHKCVYVENQALAKLAFVADSLEALEVSSCKNITDSGLLSLKELKKLKQLTTFDLPYVKHIQAVEQELKKALPQCSMDLKA
ncbi:ATP synthase subunit s, mitochondrial [Culex quinquefasciatus]|uniref:ATP synthase subunit s, mitochondrial n=1 Tax=Culex quinquefasciatus TaxID=7176 RepID=B0WKN7_CULQU|nr:ATP synthase subunit s, mitochondrial [Culex quinquefasciatus]|eukprot:XP_001849271.1 ATP synthase subunit s, mitochondrial [Culex quinquefasciatus]